MIKAPAILIEDVFNDICVRFKLNGVIQIPHILTPGKSGRVEEKRTASLFSLLVILFRSVSLKEFNDYRKEKMITSSHSFAAAELPSIARHVIQVPLHQCRCRVLQYTLLFLLKAFFPVRTVSLLFFTGE